MPVHPNDLRVVLLKPSKYRADGYVERFRRGFMPNATLPYLQSLTPSQVGGRRIQVHVIDEYVRADLDYLALLRRDPSCDTLVALVGVQSHQFHRALDLAAYARAHGVSCCVIGGPHPMTCETTELQDRGVSFALAEGELVWPSILADAAAGELRPVYGRERRWQEQLSSPALTPPSRRELRRHVVPLLGIYPARGCPYRCNFCSVIKIAGHRVRSEPVAQTLESLRAAKVAGVGMIMFTSDNFNKYPEAPALLEAIIAERIGLPFFVQCDAQIEQQEELIALLSRAGCWQIFVGVESLNRATLLEAKKNQNHPDRYARIVALCERYGIGAHFSNIVGFPGDTEERIIEHFRTLKRLDPAAASFYILTPIPGTEQYDEFQAAGLITEPNLDRFDCSAATWNHPHLTAAQLSALLFRGYREFYAVPEMIRKSVRWRLQGHSISPFGWSGFVAMWMYHRIAGSLGFHPMGGGLGQVRRDHVSDYLPLRRERYDIELAPLPRSLALSEADRALDRAVVGARV